MYKVSLQFITLINYDMKKITILIPTYERSDALTTTLTSLIGQTSQDFDIVIANQSEKNLSDSAALRAIFRILRFHNHDVTVYKNLPRKGMAQQRQFLLNRSKSIYSLFLDDDLFLEPFVVQKMINAIEEEQCGFVGQAPIGLSFVHDIRPQEQQITFWETKVKPEKITPHGKGWNRHILHNAANVLHIAQSLQITKNNPRKYKVAWVGGCVLYNTQKLREIGGFSFWKKLPVKHCGEDVL